MQEHIAIAGVSLPNCSEHCCGIFSLALVVDEELVAYLAGGCTFESLARSPCGSEVVRIRGNRFSFQWTFTRKDLATLLAKIENKRFARPA